MGRPRALTGRLTAERSEPRRSDAVTMLRLRDEAGCKEGGRIRGSSNVGKGGHRPLCPEPLGHLDNVLRNASSRRGRPPPAPEVLLPFAPGGWLPMSPDPCCDAQKTSVAFRSAFSSTDLTLGPLMGPDLAPSTFEEQEATEQKAERASGHGQRRDLERLRSPFANHDELVLSRSTTLGVYRAQKSLTRGCGEKHLYWRFGEPEGPDPPHRSILPSGRGRSRIHPGHDGSRLNILEII
jgi:hypothetical protein